MKTKFGKVNTFEVSMLRGGTYVATRNKEKAEEVFGDLCAAFPNDKVYLQVWNGSKLVSEHIGNKKAVN